MKINILYRIVDTPTGGGNQLLRSLRDRFKWLECYTDSFEEADVFLYNGHQEHEMVKQLKQKYPNKTFIHRLDGLQKLYNEPNDIRQDQALEINKIADGTIFQSHWTKEEFRKVGFDNRRRSRVIHNAANTRIFYPDKTNNSSKTILVTSSWSDNWKKGFKYYKYLDENLDFNKYEYWFIGNSPFVFKNIEMIKPLTSQDLSIMLRKADIFISGVQFDACSNSILEALATALPVVALDSGANSELVNNNGMLFNGIEDVIEKIDEVNVLKEKISRNINTKNTEQVALEYINFFEGCLK